MPARPCRRPCRRLARASCARAALAALLALTAAPAFAQAPPVADRSEVEERKRREAERERLKAEAEVKETAEQREERERQEKRDNNAREALRRAQQALQAAAQRQNLKGMQLMQAAWMLDPTNIDYPFNTAAFAEALNEMETEFRAHAAVRVLARKALAALPPDSPRRQEVQERIDKAEHRLEFLRGKLSTGVLQITSEPRSCDVLLEGAWVGTGGGEMEAITGQRKVEARCQGYYDTELFANVRVGDPSQAVIKPKQIAYFGKLIVKVEPADGVTVFLDDVKIDERLADKPSKDGAIVGKGSKAEPYELAARKWIIRFQKEGYDRWHRRIEIKRDQATMVEARLEALNETIDEALPKKK